MTIVARASLVDGSLWEFEVEPAAMRRLETLEARGVSGRALIDQAIGDDWGAPPVYVDVTGTMPDGRKLNKRIAYD